MPTSIALLRGVNVGGKHALPMAMLRDALEEVGYTSVQTYIQSGNIVLEHPRRGAAALTRDLEREIAGVAGFDVPVVVRSAAQLAAVIDANPFPRVDGTKLHVAFMSDTPPRAALAAIDRDKFLPDEFVVKRDNVYLHLPNGMGRSKLGQSMRLVNTSATVRNWNTVLKLRELSTR
jgi:uncharacterized protein (DUF1697 family)